MANYAQGEQRIIDLIRADSQRWTEANSFSLQNDLTALTRTALARGDRRALVASYAGHNTVRLDIGGYVYEETYRTRLSLYAQQHDSDGAAAEATLLTYFEELATALYVHPFLDNLDGVTDAYIAEGLEPFTPDAGSDRFLVLFDRGRPTGAPLAWKKMEAIFQWVNEREVAPLD